MFDVIAPEIEKFYGRATFDEFYRRFAAAGHEYLLHLPLLNRSAHAHLKETKVSQIDFPCMESFRFRNSGSKQGVIAIRADFSKCQNVPELLRAFIRVAHHSPRLAHFRDHPNLYAPILAGNRYLACHGDGFCTMLSLLFQGLAHEMLGAKVDSMYCRNEDFMMSHGYCRTFAGKTELYADPDLKDCFERKDFAEFEPASWFLNLIENVAIRAFHALDQGMRERLFFKLTRDYFQWLLECCTRELSMPGSRYGITLKDFRETVTNHSEVLDITLDDYPWKAKYRAVVRRDFPESKSYFMHGLDKPLLISLAPGQEFFSAREELNSSFALKTLFSIFFGRTPGCLMIPVSKQVPVEFDLPEIPWLIRSEIGNVTVNGKVISLKKMEGDDGLVAGMGDMQSLLDELKLSRRVHIKAEQDCTLKIYFPLNASFWNSSLIAVSELEGSHLAVSAAEAKGAQPGKTL